MNILKALKQLWSTWIDHQLLDAMEKFDLRRFHWALRLGANPHQDVLFQPGYPLVTRCTRSGDTSFLSLLLKYGADVHAHCTSGQFSPLHMAVLKNQLPCIEMLLAHGASIDFLYQPEGTDTPCWSPLILALQSGPSRSQAACLLISLGADTSLKDHHQRSCMTLAQHHHMPEVVALLEQQLLQQALHASKDSSKDTEEESFKKPIRL